MNIMNIIHRRRRGAHRVRIAIASTTIGFCLLLVTSPSPVEAAAEKPDRSRKYRLVAEDVDNEGPIGREGWAPPRRSRIWHRPDFLHWHSPVRVDLILPIRTLPRPPLRRR